jgi:hypothetical protein
MELICTTCDQLCNEKDVRKHEGKLLHTCGAEAQEFAVFLRQGAQGNFALWFKWMQSDEADKYRIE